MSDPYLPPTGANPTMPSRDLPDNSANRAFRQVPTPVAQESGFGMGMLVAMLIVVVAILSFAFYGPPAAENAVPAPAAPAATTPDAQSQADLPATAPAAETAIDGAANPIVPAAPNTVAPASN